MGLGTRRQLWPPRGRNHVWQYGRRGWGQGVRKREKKSENNCLFSNLRFFSCWVFFCEDDFSFFVIWASSVVELPVIWIKDHRWWWRFFGWWWTRQNANYCVWGVWEMNGDGGIWECVMTSYDRVTEVMWISRDGQWWFLSILLVFVLTFTILLFFSLFSFCLLVNVFLALLAL